MVSKVGADNLILIGFRHSVYTRIVRMALIEMGMQATYTEADPFADTPDPVLAAHTPFQRVPVLRHGAFTLTETAAILRYLDGVGPRPSLVPEEVKAAARMVQVIGIVDAYGYGAMVRDVFSHGFYRPHMGEDADPRRITAGLDAATPVLDLLEKIAAEGHVLNPPRLTLADLHLAPMMDYFTRVPQGAAALAGYGALHGWWEAARTRSSLRATDPFEDR
jgi:glutathione S-transferase